MKLRIRIALALTVPCLVAASLAARAENLGDFDIDTRFRAKIVKERAKQASKEASEADKNNKDFAFSNDEDAECGSQNIGNVNTGNQPGRAPREVFVFAPNSINVVTGRGCR